jgi:hypothetical protein
VSYRFIIDEVGIDYEDEGEDLETLPGIYKKFLVGSKVLKQLEVTTWDQLATLAQVALNYPLSLQQLREVQNGGYIAGSLLYANDQPERDDLFDLCFKVTKIGTNHPMILISHF